MTKCYFCEEQQATGTRYGKPACNDCQHAEIRMICNQKLERNWTEEERAKRLKIMIRTFKDAFSEE
jgi:AraC-like DNA-binding protein